MLGSRNQPCRPQVFQLSSPRSRFLASNIAARHVENDICKSRANDTVSLMLSLLDGPKGLSGYLRTSPVR